MTEQQMLELIYCMSEQGSLDAKEIDNEELKIEANRQEEALQKFHAYCVNQYDDFLTSHKL